MDAVAAREALAADGLRPALGRRFRKPGVQAPAETVAEACATEGGQEFAWAADDDSDLALQELPTRGPRLESKAEEDFPDGTGAEGSEPGDAIQLRPKLEIQKVLPEDRLRNVWEERYGRKSPENQFEQILPWEAAIAKPYPLVPGEDPLGFFSDQKAKDAYYDRETADQIRRVSQVRRFRALNKMQVWDNPYRALQRSSAEEKELVARESVAELQQKSAEHEEKERKRHRVAQDIGTGAASPAVYVEIRPRTTGPDEEEANAVVAEGLGISLEMASRLVELGAAWVFDEDYEEWDRIYEARKIDASQVVRVFPNPERFKTCYVEDWDERVKSVDPDYVVIDKPPLLPCFPQVSNMKESLSYCMREAIRHKHMGGPSSTITDDFTPLTTIDDEASGLVVLSRHEAAGECFDTWLREKNVVFEFVALTTKMVEKGFYRHYYRKSAESGALDAELYEEESLDYKEIEDEFQDFGLCEMEVLATAPLSGEHAALRIRTHGTGAQERIRAQLAMLGAPVLNDPVVHRKADATFGSTGASSGDSWEVRQARLTLSANFGPMAGAVDEETLHSPYGNKLQLLPEAEAAAQRGLPQQPRKKVPVALHLARIEFGGRIVTCPPPKYWPEGAAAAVAVRLTEQDIKKQISAFIAKQSGRAKFGTVGGKFGVKVEYLEEHFPIDRSAGLVFASADSKKLWENSRRVSDSEKFWCDDSLFKTKRAKHKRNLANAKMKYLRPEEWGKVRLPTYQDIKRGRVEKITES